MNKCIFTGTITSKGVAAKNYGQNNDLMVTFSISIYEGKDKAGQPMKTYIPCVAYKKTAEMINNNFTAGKSICVEAKYSTNKYTDKNTGQERYSSNFIVSNVHFLPKDFSESNTVTNNYNQQASQGNEYNVNQNQMPTTPQNPYVNQNAGYSNSLESNWESAGGDLF